MKTTLLTSLLLISFVISAQSTVTYSGCKASFSYALNTQIKTFAPATVLDFTDRSEEDVINWFWDFGDGYTSTEQNPTHIFNLPIAPDDLKVMANPYRTVTLSILTSDSCKNFYSETIDIYNQPIEQDSRCNAFYRYEISARDSINRTITYQFTNLSEGDSLSYYWKFDNDEMSTEANPSVTYDYSAPIRKVALYITSASGCTSAYAEDLFIDPDSNVTYPIDTIYNPKCFAAFGYTVNYDIKTLLPALVLDFYIKSDDPIEKCLWDFGDGNYSEEHNPTHIFNIPLDPDSLKSDLYRTVCLITTTQSGCETTWCQDILINKGTTPSDQCNAWFKYYIPSDVETIPEVIPYKFTASADNIVSWSWSFSDGTVSYDPEPLVTFDRSKATQDVCLTILTADSCSSTWCETIYINPTTIDTIVPTDPVCKYSFKYTSYYPAWASACIGTATAQVVLNDSAISTEYYYWTSGYGDRWVDGPEIDNLCPTGTYTVTALTTDGCKFSGSFIFNSDGTITEIPVNWWINGEGDDSYIEYSLNNPDYRVEWILCDGTVVSGDSIRLSDIDCGTNETNMFLKDNNGNVIYSKSITGKSDLLSSGNPANPSSISYYPIPVTDWLNVTYNNQSMGSIRFEVCDISGKCLLKQNINQIKKGETFHINVSSLKKGIYLGKIFSDNHPISVGKFIK